MEPTGSVPPAQRKTRTRTSSRTIKEEQTTRSVGSSPAGEVKRETGGKTATRRDDEFDHCHEFIQRSATTHRDLVGHVFYLLLRQRLYHRGLGDRRRKCVNRYTCAGYFF